MYNSDRQYYNVGSLVINQHEIEILVAQINE